MRIKQATVKFGFTKNLGNFESMRVDVEFSASVEDNESHMLGERWIEINDETICLLIRGAGGPF